MTERILLLLFRFLLVLLFIYQAKEVLWITNIIFFYIIRHFKKFEKIYYFYYVKLYISIILTNLQNSDKNNPAVRMFSNTYNQVMKIDKSQDFNNDNNLLNKENVFI